jgi:hypothetical protein
VVKLDIGLPVDGVVELVVSGTVHGDDGEVLAFALAAIPSRHGIVLDLSRAACDDDTCTRAIRSALTRFRRRSPAIEVRGGPASVARPSRAATLASARGPDSV